MLSEIRDFFFQRIFLDFHSILPLVLKNNKKRDSPPLFIIYLGKFLTFNIYSSIILSEGSFFRKPEYFIQDFFQKKKILFNLAILYYLFLELGYVSPIKFICKFLDCNSQLCFYFFPKNSKGLINKINLEILLKTILKKKKKIFN